MPGPLESMAPRDAAQSVARDLVRLVRAVERGAGLDSLSGLQRAQLDALRRALVRMYRAPPRPGIACELARLKEYLDSTRKAILAALPQGKRLEVLEALLKVEVNDDEARGLIAPAEPSDGRGASPARRLPFDDDDRRRAIERRTLAADGTLAGCFASLPEEWRRAIWRAAGLEGAPEADEMSRILLDPDALRALIEELHPVERAALTTVVDAGGVVPAKELEGRFGDSTGDGFDWERDPPTSILGRLRLRGLCVVGRLPRIENARSRPRVVFVPTDLREPLARTLAACGPAPSASTTIAAEIIGDAMSDAAAETLAHLAHAQPELTHFATTLEQRVSRAVPHSALVGMVAGVWRSFERAHPRRVPRLRARDIDIAKRAALLDLSAVSTTHIRIVQRRVVRMISTQPHLYAYLANVLEMSAWSEEDKLLVFHACDVAIRAFQAVL